MPKVAGIGALVHAGRPPTPPPLPINPNAFHILRGTDRPALGTAFKLFSSRLLGVGVGH
jgi:hypothetical protein